MVELKDNDVYFKHGDILIYNNMSIIKIDKIRPGSWNIINTSNNKVRNLVTCDNDEIYLKLIEHFIHDVSIILKDGEHLQFVDDTNETVRQN